MEVDINCDLIENLPDTIQKIKVYQPPLVSQKRAKKKVDYNEFDDDDEDFDPDDYSDGISDEDDAFLQQNDDLDHNNNLNDSCPRLRGLSVADVELIDLTSTQQPKSPLVCARPANISLSNFNSEKTALRNDWCD